MSVYLPIAGMPANIWLFLGMGAAVGFLSGLFGVGGGFLMTPLLIFSGIPPAVAVGTQASPLLAASVSGAIAHYRRGNIDVTLGTVLLAGGLAGAAIGVEMVRILRAAGHFDVFLALNYAVFLGVVGSLMMAESLAALRRTHQGRAPSMRRGGEHGWISGLPFKMRFRRSKLYISIIPPLVIGAFVGLLAAVMGVGGGFIMVPALIYLLRVPTNVVIGTSLFQIVFVSAATAVLHASQNKNVDIVLAFLLMLGGALGAQWGTAAGERLRGEQLRFLLAALVLLVCLRVGWETVTPPADLYSLGSLLGGR